jgi:hypothetical protein
MTRLATRFAPAWLALRRLALLRRVCRRWFRRVAGVLAQTLTQHRHLSFADINLRDLLTQLGELVFIGLRAEFQ